MKMRAMIKIVMIWDFPMICSATRVALPVVGTVFGS